MLSPLRNNIARSLLVTSTAIATAVALFTGGCSSDSSSGGASGGAAGSSGSGAVGSCVHGKDSCNPGTEACCADFHGTFTATSVQMSCSVAMGTYSPDPCPTDMLEASCTLYAGTAAEKVIRYYTGYDALSMSDPMTNCAALRGTYAPAN